MAWTRASNLHRALACPGNGFLPVEDLRSGSTIEKGAWGTLAHSWKARGWEGVEAVPGFERHLPLFEKKLRTCWGDLETAERARLCLWPETGVHERSVAYNCETGSVAWSDTTQPDEWKAKFPDEWITGTMDFRDDLFGEAWVDDLKTGTTPSHPDDEQSLLYCLVDWTLRGAVDDRMASSITHWHRYPVPTLPWRDEMELTAKTLDQFQRECRMGYLMRRRAELGPIEDYLVTGDQCRYCPSRNHCPMEKPDDY